MTAPNLKPSLFVYLGQRYGNNKKRYCVIQLVSDTGVLDGSAQMYSYSAKLANKMVGGVYKGAEFNNDGQSMGLASSRFHCRWKNNDDVIVWQAAESEAEALRVNDKLETDEKQIGEIEKILLPLRHLYRKAYDSRDYGTMNALETAVRAALKSKPRATEKV